MATTFPMTWKTQRMIGEIDSIIMNCVLTFKFLRHSRMRDIMALPIKKRGRPKKILTDYEIEEATRAAMYTRPAIEITKVPRVYSAEGLAISRELALDLIIKAVEKVEGPDPTLFVAKKSAPGLVPAVVPALAPVLGPALAPVVAPVVEAAPVSAPVPVPAENEDTPKVRNTQQIRCC